MAKGPDRLVQHIRRLVKPPPAPGVTDGQLLGRFAADRDEAAFRTIVERHGRLVWGVCRRLLYDPNDIEDAFQAVFLALVKKAHTLDRRPSLANWLFTVARLVALEMRAKKKIRQAREAKAPSRQPSDPLSEVTGRELYAALDEELARLPEKYRTPLLLCYLEGKTRDEAAGHLGWTATTVKGRLERGRDLLRRRLTRRGLSLSAALPASLMSEATGAVPSTLAAATTTSALLFAAGQTGAISASAAAVAENVLKGMVMTKSKIAVGLLLAAGIVGGGGTIITYAASHGQRTETKQAEAAEAGAVRAAPLNEPLPARGTVRLGTARYRHGSRIESMAVSADGKLAVTASGWGVYHNPPEAFSPARVFDLTDGRCLYSVPSECWSGTEAVGLSPDGKTLATKDDKYLRFLDAATGKELRKRKLYLPDSGGGRSITDWLTFTPDGKQVAATLWGDAIRLIDVGTCKVIRTFAPGAAGSACVFSPDGKLMATAGYEKERGGYLARLWEVGTGKELRRFPVGNFPAGNGRERALAFSPDGATLAGGGWGDARLRLWETATGKEPIVFPKIGEDIRSVAFAPDGKTVAAAADSIYLYDPSTGKERLRIDRRAQRLAFSRDGLVLIGAVSGAIYRWDTASGRQLTPAAAQDSAVEQILASPDGRSIFTTDQDGDLYLWDTTGRKPPRRIVGGVERGVVASPDGRFLAWTVKHVHGGRQIRLYDALGQRVIDRFPIFTDDACVVAFLPDGKTLLTLGRGHEPATVRLWDVESGKERRSFAANPLLLAGEPFYTPRRAALSPDGRTLAIGIDWEGSLRAERMQTKHRDVPVRLWDVATGKARHKLDEPMNGANVPDEAGAGDQEDLSLVHVNWRMRSADGRAFSPDGQFLVDWAENPFGRSRMDHVYVWDLATGRAVASLAPLTLPSPPGEEGRVRGAGAANAAFAPDGHTLATASADGTIRLWETATWKVRAELRGHRDRVTTLAFGPDGRLFTGGLDTVVLGWDVRPPRGAARGSLADAWEALASADAGAGFQAQGRFLAEPGRAVAWFGARLTPAARLDPSRAKGLIADLDSGKFANRERATAELKEHWPETAAALREFVAEPSSLEARRRVEGILREMEKAVTPPGALRAVRAVEVLRWIATKEARRLLLELAKGAPHVRLTREAAAACKRLGEGR